MNRNILVSAGVCMMFATWFTFAGPAKPVFLFFTKSSAPDDTIKKSRKPTYKPKDRYGDRYSDPQSNSPLILDDPPSLQQNMELDDSMDTFIIEENVGGSEYRPPSSLTWEEYQEMMQREMIKNYWKGKGPDSVQQSEKNFKPPVIEVKRDGKPVAEIRPTGFVTLDFGGKFQRVNNPAIPVRQQRNGIFDFDQQISMNVVGKIADRLKLTVNWDTKATFEFQNNIKVEFDGKEEDIVKKIDVGVVNFPLNTTLINGSQNLFGVKAKLQFGRLTMTTVFSSQRGKTEEIRLQGGAQTKTFELRCDNYEEYRHFFLSHFNRGRYEPALEHLPLVNSGVKITRIEVYVTNRTNQTQGLRDMVAYTDLGEAKISLMNPTWGIPTNPNSAPADNQQNTLYNTVSPYRNSNTLATDLQAMGLIRGTDFEIIQSARKLSDKDFTYHPDLGYITLNTQIKQDEVLAVAFQYSYEGKTYKVGELTEDYQTLEEKDVVILKLIKPSTVKTRMPTWDLMMKNVYSLGATQLTRDNFQLRVIYKDDYSGADLPNFQHGQKAKNVPLLKIVGLDRLNPNNDPYPDGNFDYVEGVTIDSRNGRIFFPTLEPFGSNLDDWFPPSEAAFQAQYEFIELYDSTKSDAWNAASKNKYFLKGRFQSSNSSEIILPGINIAPGSVTVTAGSNVLREGSDYTVDYMTGRLKIINEGILASGQEIKVRFEKQDLFNFRRKNFYGARFDYGIGRDINIGATVLHQNEAPNFTRVNIGDEPSSNTMLGTDIQFRKDSRFTTKMLDKLPLISTKATSTYTFNGEYAALLPGHNNIINRNDNDANGTAYIDDFETVKTPYDFARTPSKWRLASTPQRFSDHSSSGLNYAYHRANLSWYNIDNIFYRTNNNLPSNLQPDSITNHYVRNIIPQEIFPNQNRQQVQTNQVTLDLAYYPSERGMYNYNPAITTNNGRLPDPELNWGGIMREIRNDIDFDNANIQYIEFWMLDPFITSTKGNTNIDGTPFDLNNRGKLYFNLGSISEDVMKNELHDFENGLPENGDISGLTSSPWGVTTTQQYLTQAFNSNPDSRPNQDVGLDGLNNENEGAHFASFITAVSSSPMSQARKNEILADPSNDDFVYFLGDDFDNSKADILQRYKRFFGMENNSPISTGGSGPVPASTTIPDNEDLNQNNTIDALDEYYEYEVDIDPGEFEVGENYIVGQQQVNVNGETVTWYQFRIPIRTPDNIVGNISGYKSIKFMRMYMTGFETPVVLRFAQLQLVANQWRVYLPDDLNEPGSGISTEPDNTLLDVSTVNIEENSQGSPTSTPYVLPPGFIRDQDVTTTINRQLNEQSIRLCVTDLDDGSARAVYKNVSLDFMNYGRIKAFIHAETQDISLSDGEATAFVRIGTDFVSNYYEIEVPLHFTNPLNSSDPYMVWRGENWIDIAISDLTELKLLRNRETENLNVPFKATINGKNIYVMGNPDLSTVVTLMIGVRNPRSADREDFTFCMWMDEFRLADFNQKAAHAATARMNIRLADFATLNGTIRYTGIGFGGLDQKVSQRERASTLDWGIAGNFAVDKLLPQKWGLKLPMYVGYNRKVITPQYDPLNPDIRLNASIDNKDPEDRENYRRLVLDQTTQRAINFTNIQKIKTNTNSPSRIYGIENFTLSLGYQETYRTSYDIHKYQYKNYNGAIGYSFSAGNKTWEPFKKDTTRFMNKKYMKLFKDFNIGYMPSNITAQVKLDRRITTSEWYESGPLSDVQTPLYEKAFTFNRTYGFTWNFSQKLNLNFRTNAFAIVDEPQGAPGSKAYRDSVWSNVLKGGRLKNADQMMELKYEVPLSKIPAVDWISPDVRYTGGYVWTASALGIQDTMGNVIGNTSERAMNLKFGMDKLYNKSKFLREINQPKPPTKPAPPKGKPDTTQVVKKENKALKAAFRTMMMLKNVNITYTQTMGTNLAGYMRTPTFVGLSSGDDLNNGWLPFILGSQDPNIRHVAAENGWISRSRYLNIPFTQTKNYSLVGRATIEPFKEFRITVDAKKQFMNNYQEIFRIDSMGQQYTSDNPSRTGNYSISFISILTAFNSDKAFSTFLANLNEIQAIKGSSYDIRSQDVMIPAFLAAYSGRKVNQNKLSSFPKIPIPNWRIDFTGLSKIPSLKKKFQTIAISHQYSSTYTVGSFTSSLIYGANYIRPDENIYNINQQNQTLQLNQQGQFVPVYIIDGVSIRETFSPLVGVNMRTKGNATYKIDFSTNRMLTLNMSNAQLTEDMSKTITLGYAYTKKGMAVPKIFTGGRKVPPLKGDITMRMDVAIRDQRVQQRKLDNTTVITAGNLNFQFKPSVMYQFSTRVTGTAYFERSINSPRISTSFRRAVTNFGIQIRFSLS